MWTIGNTDWLDVVGSMEIQVGAINALFQEDQCPRMMETIPDYL